MEPTVVHAFNFNLNYADMLMQDVPDERMAEQPFGSCNHAAWNLGHIIYSLNFLRQLAGAPADPEPIAEKQFEMGSSPTDDRAAYPSKDELLSKLAATHDALTPALQAMDADALNRPNPDEGFRGIMPTVGDAVMFLATTHYGVHLGEVAAWRKAVGLPRVV